MAVAEVTVQRLRLRSRLAVPGLLPKVQDALRVSSKPATLLNRLVLVRRLRLRAATGASTQTLALQLERAWQQLAAQAQPMELASAAAEAVWAPSLAAARQALLTRWLRGEAAEAWFWQRIAPPQAGEGWPARAVALMTMADEADAAETVALDSPRRQAARVRALLSLIVEHRKLTQFIEGITDAQAMAVLKAMQALETVAEPVHRQHHASSMLWARPAVVTPRARLAERMTPWFAGAEDSPVEHPVADAAIADRAADAAAADLAAAQRKDQPASLVAPASATVRLAGAVTTAASAVWAGPVLPPQPVLGHSLASPWSGVWLLLPLLLRHGLDDAGDPLAAWAGALRAALRRFRVPPDDLIHTAIDALDVPAAESPDWLRIARLAAVHDAGLPLLRIARRRGAAWISPERIDIEFPPTSLDLRIRRAGFDINPGFVPWLGRIVHFHYPS